MISENRYLFRAPLLDAKQQVIGYTLAYQKHGDGGVLVDTEDASDLLALVAQASGEIKAGRLFLNVQLDWLTEHVVRALSPQHTVLILKPADLLEADYPALAASLRERGFGLGLREVDIAFLKLKEHEAPLSHINHVLVAFDNAELAAITSFAKQRLPPIGVMVDKVPGWKELDACIGPGSCGVFAKLCQAPREIKQQTKLGPQALQILQLMQMVQGNADIRHLEKVLKSDVTLSYKLLRYINSAGFGLEVEIESPRQAVAMLGYAPLFRWLLLLLARTHTTGFSPALMQAAMVRGRFAELLGQGFLPRREAENLFVVGMFSFLDRLLGIPVQDVMGQLMLPDAVEAALLAREGVYAPVLALAEACEQDDSHAAQFAQALSLTAEHTNTAHLSAIAWAQNIKI